MSKNKKVVQFPTKELKINISYVAVDGVSYFVTLKNTDEQAANEVLSGVVYALEKVSKERLDELKGDDD